MLFRSPSQVASAAWAETAKAAKEARISGVTPKVLLAADTDGREEEQKKDGRRLGYLSFMMFGYSVNFFERWGLESGCFPGMGLTI